jgi:prepilin-type N-terminal cleavage/methylation domain-containing protein
VSAPFAPSHAALARRPFRVRRARAGLSLVEVMVSMVIASALLTAIAAAFSASASAIEMNDQFFRASQATRISVNQIMTEARKCMSGVVAPTSLELITDKGETRTYALTGNQLTMTVADPVAPRTYRLASNVESLQFQTNGKAVSMVVTVKVGNNAVTLTGSAIPRRTITYEE